MTTKTKAPLILISAAAIFVGGQSAFSQTETLVLKIDGSTTCEIPIADTSSMPSGDSVQYCDGAGADGCDTGSETVSVSGVVVDVEIDDQNPPSCFGSGGAPIDVTVNLFDNSNNQPISGQVPQGTEVRVEWSLVGLTTATSCTPSGGTFPGTFNSDFVGNPRPSSGNHIQTVSSTTTFSLTCDNGSDTASAQVSVAGGGGQGIPQSCIDAGRVTRGASNRIADMTWRSGGLFGNLEGPTIQTDFEDVWGAWPGVPSSGQPQMVFTIGAANWIAMQFQQVSMPSNATGLFSIDKDADSLARNLIISIADCPGDFRAALGSCRVSIPGESGSFRWHAGGLGSGCALTPGTTYWINFTWAEDANPTQGTCPGACAPLVNYSHNQ